MAPYVDDALAKGPGPGVVEEVLHHRPVRGQRLSPHTREAPAGPQSRVPSCPLRLEEGRLTAGRQPG